MTDAGPPAGGGDAPAPRLAPLPPAQWDDLLQRLLPASAGPGTRPAAIFATLARHPELFRRWLGFGGALLAGRLTPRLRELVILRTAANCDSDYEQAHHEPLARQAGVDEAELAALRRPVDAHRWPPAEAAALRAADELHADGTVGDGTWAALRPWYDDADLVELVMLVGQYHLVSFCLHTFGIRLQDDALAPEPPAAQPTGDPAAAPPTGDPAP